MDLWPEPGRRLNFFDGSAGAGQHRINGGEFIRQRADIIIALAFPSHGFVKMHNPDFVRDVAIAAR